jgi:hypothetical protein
MRPNIFKNEMLNSFPGIHFTVEATTQERPIRIGASRIVSAQAADRIEMR